MMTLIGDLIRPECYECGEQIVDEEPRPWYIRETRRTEWLHQDCLRRFLG